MIRAFKEFWMDYWKLCKESMSLLKKHWLGYIILCIVVFAITLIPAYLNCREIQKDIDKTLDKMLENAPTIKMDDLEKI